MIEGFQGDPYSRNNINQPSEPTQPPGPQAAPPPDGANQYRANTNDNGGGGSDEPPNGGDGRTIRVHVKLNEKLPKCEARANNCLERAAEFASNLNQTCFDVHHLMLALTVDQRAGRMLGDVGDIKQLRDFAVEKIGKMHSQFAAGVTDSDGPLVTEDLWDLLLRAKQKADDRGQEVAISDLVEAFPTDTDGKLKYGRNGDLNGGSVTAVVESVTRSVVQPMVSVFHAQVREATQPRFDEISRDLGQLKLRLDAIIGALKDEPETLPPSEPEPQSKDPLARLRRAWVQLIL